MAFMIRSSAFENGAMIPKKWTCDGEDQSPPLEWAGAPAGVKSFALIMDDPDAPPGTWVHWVIYNIAGDAKELGEGLPKDGKLANGVMQGMVWGVSEFGRVGYYGPCPPPGTPHRYLFKLYALDTMLNLSAKATKFDVEKGMKGHVLGETQLMGRYGR